MKTLFLLILVFLFPLQVFAEEAIVNSQVEVDVVGKDPADAKAQAMAKGEVDALTDLLNKLAPSGMTPDIIATMDARKISNMVKNNEVLDEKITGNRYHANLMISFDGNELSALITKASTKISEEKSATVSAFLIIPVYQLADGKPVLWGDENPWFDVWKNVGLEVTSGDVIVPYGDAKDGNTVGIQNYETATFASLVPMTIRYGVSDIVILSANLTAKPDLMVTVTKRRIARGRNELSVLTYRADPQETRDLLLARAARDTIYGLQHKKSEELSTIQNVRGGERHEVMMLASISTLDTWTALREKISALPMVDKIDVLAISARQVDMVLHYRGSEESMTRAIEAQKIKLLKNKDYWVVSHE